QEFPSSHARAPPLTHAPSLPLQWSPTVQAVPSSQDTLTGRGTQPPAGSQTPVRHGPAQVCAVPGRQVSSTPLQASPTVQASPSEQESPCARTRQPSSGSQTPVRHSPAHEMAGPGTQAPLPSQASFLVQTLPSSQGAPAGWPTQPAGSQKGIG